MVNESARTYREIQHFATWAYPLLGVFLAFFWYHALTVPYPIHLVFIAISVALSLLAAFIVTGTLRMTTEVRGGQIHIRYGYFPYFRKVIPSHLVDRVEVVEFLPAEYAGGWVKYSERREALLYAGGRRGVRLRLAGSDPLIVGSRNPKGLAEAIRCAMPGVEAKPANR